VIDWSAQAIAAVENVVYFAICTAFFASMYRRSRQSGQFARNEE
jgi:hypothetical protein